MIHSLIFPRLLYEQAAELFCPNANKVTMEDMDGGA